ncbi:hypothetical protein Efla_006590 [Eimeria flavescens]
MESLAEKGNGGGPQLCSELPPIEVGNGKKIKVTDLVALCREACAAILEVYRQPEEEWKLQHKDGVEPLTKADLDSNKESYEDFIIQKKENAFNCCFPSSSPLLLLWLHVFTDLTQLGRPPQRLLFLNVLLDGLQVLCPDCLVVSEESPHASHAERRSAEFVWLVDPLDGTKEFLKRSGDFAVNLGLCRDGLPVFGIVAAPTQDLLFLGGPLLGGAWKMEGSSQRLSSICCREFRWSDAGLRVTASSSHNSPATQQFIARLIRPNLVKAGSSLKFIKVAAGEADLYARFAPCSEWDTCAPHAILLAAGGEILKWEDAGAGGPLGPLEYNKASLLSPFFVAVGRLAEGEEKAPPPVAATQPS